MNTDDLAVLQVNQREAEFYSITNIGLPVGAVAEAGSLRPLPDGRLAMGTRRGDVFLGSGAEGTPPVPVWK
ncbi:MAG: hypothetical protein NTX04_02240, partial [Verrucomicrobia bacterium]|nr:hypothetical protein [Verrucomicrobiota bacterium]